MAGGSRTVGFWEPHTSSIDFCEENYRFTIYVAELLNSVSSLPIAITGAWAWALTPAAFRCRWRFALCWLAFIAIGLGSFAFHATLRRPAQALDEVPMVLANLVFVYCLTRPEGEWAFRLASYLGASGLLLVVIYAVFEFYAVFFVMYGVVVVYLATHSGMLSWRDTHRLNSCAMWQLWKLAIAAYGSGFVLWVADNVVCSQLGVGHLHIAWHALACMGTMLFVLLLIAITADEEGIEVSLEVQCGFMPYLAVKGSSQNGAATKKSS